MKNLILFVVLVCSVSIVGLVGCKNEGGNAVENSVSSSNSVFEALEKVIEEKPTDENISKLMDAVFKKYKSLDSGSEEARAILVKGTEYCEKYNKTSTSSLFYLPLLRDFYNPKTASNDLYKLIQAMKSIKKDAVVDVLSSNFVKLYPKDANAESVKAMISKGYVDMDSYLKSQADKVFKKDENKIQHQRSVREYVDVCEAYALSDPMGSKTPAYLYKGSELARSIKSLDKVVSLYDWIIKKYPTFDKVATVHFLKGFILENEMGNPEKAKEVYESFLSKYPKHELVDDVQFLIKNIGKSNDEILKMLGKDK